MSTKPSFGNSQGTEPGNQVILDYLDALSDPDVVMSTHRNIGYKPEGSSEFEVVFDVVGVVRDNPAIRTSVEEWPELISNALGETIWKWYECAVRVWNGNPSADELNETTFPLPPRTGSANITVFGVMLDRQGRHFSVTVTDQTNYDDIVALIPYQIGMYDAVTKISGDVDLSPYGNMKYRKTTSVKHEQKSWGGNRSNNRSYGNNNRSSAPQEPVSHCANTSELKNAPVDQPVTFDVYKLSLSAKPDGTNVLNLYGKGADGNTDNDTGMFVYSNRSWYPALMNNLTKSVPEMANPGTKEFDSPLKFVVTKRATQKGSFYYNPIVFRAE